VSRILLTWELGLNLGHLTRLLPLAQHLKAQGHTVLVATRDIQAASRVLGPARIAFMQAPHLAQGIPLAHRPSGYADILLSQGWSSPAVLHALTHAWLNLFRLYNPERLILDYSPTVSLAARIANLPTALVGNGFELPPATDPLPHFPGFSWATAAKAANSETLAITHANAVLNAFSGRPLTALRDLMAGQHRFLATFPELDHYGERAEARYIGPLLGTLQAPRVDWPAGEGPKIFVCLRPDTNHVRTLLAALTEVKGRIICVATGFTREALEPFRKEHIHYYAGLVDLSTLTDADLCITYGAEGTLLRFLLAGVPQLISPWHVETYMVGRRIEALRLGRMLADPPSPQSLVELVNSMCSTEEYRSSAQAFAHRHRDERNTEQAILEMTRTIDPTARSNPEGDRSAGPPVASDPPPSKRNSHATP